MPELSAFAPDRAVDRAAAERFAATELPSPEEEVWRYSRIADLELARFAPAAEEATRPAADLPQRVRDVLALAEGTGSLAAVTVNGRLVHQQALGGRADGGTLTAEAAPARLESTDVFALLNEAFATPLVVRTSPGATIDPVVIVHWIDGTGVAAFPRTVVDAGADSELAVLEVLLSADGCAAFVDPVVELHIGKAARVGHLGVQDLGLDVWQVANQLSTVDADATLTVTAAAFGGEYARLRTDCRLVGRGATGRLRALYFGEADQALDFRTFQDHAAPDTTSELLYKGAVGGRSRSIYTGLIRVRPDARGTNAFQTNRNIKLSDGAWAESVPNLEIENNDVRCSHASAVGPVDEEQRFYLESRGVPPQVAERLIVAGFFDEVLDDLPVSAAIGPLRELVNGKLDRRES